MKGAAVTRSNIAEAETQKALSMFDVRLHVLSEGDSFDLDKRRPVGALTVEESHALERQASEFA